MTYHEVCFCPKTFKLTSSLKPSYQLLTSNSILQNPCLSMLYDLLM